MEVARDLELPAPARRLLGCDADEAPTVLDPWIMARLLEDGDRADLAWLCERLREGTLAAWLEEHGARRLSRRSLALWAVLLDRPGLRPERLPALARRRELWPL